MTRNSYKRNIDDLQKQMLKLGTHVEELIQQAITALTNQDTTIAQKVIEGDDKIDRLELELEKQCLTLMATQQPLARDLRLIGTILKTITDLERIADHAVDIAHVTIALEGQPLIKPLIDIPRMGQCVRRMLHDVLTAFINEDADLAERVGQRDCELDNLYRQIFSELLVLMMRNPSTIEQATQLLLVGLYLERMGDHAVNIAEWIYYMVRGIKPSPKW